LVDVFFGFAAASAAALAFVAFGLTGVLPPDFVLVTP
jgi:hypothetical protein